MLKNRIVSLRTLSLWGAIWISLITFGICLALIMSSTPAHAAGLKHVFVKRDSWSMNRLWTAPNNVGSGTHIEEVRDTINTTYLFWPDGSDVNKIAISHVEVCYTLYDQGSLFQGVNANPYYRDDNDILGFGVIEVPKVSGSDHACDDYTIPESQRVWFRMGQDPEWFATGKIRLKFTPDDDFNFKYLGNEVKYFHPGDDPTLGEFDCECNYGGATH